MLYYRQITVNIISIIIYQTLNQVYEKVIVDHYHLIIYWWYQHFINIYWTECTYSIHGDSKAWVFTCFVIEIRSVDISLGIILSWDNMGFITQPLYLDIPAIVIIIISKIKRPTADNIKRVKYYSISYNINLMWKKARVSIHNIHIFLLPLHYQD